MSKYKVYLCGTGDSPLVLPNGTCKNASNHTPHPSSYLDHAEWADRMMRSHRQKKCPYCKLWVIWVLK